MDGWKSSVCNSVGHEMSYSYPKSRHQNIGVLMALLIVSEHIICTVCNMVLIFGLN